ncbi:hypothetical protein FRB99_008488 [Tulasnella sp. 403]|nr:hypothetical protein FRB99_008488 [Tulasnella sp. 403]
MLCLSDWDRFDIHAPLIRVLSFASDEVDHGTLALWQHGSSPANPFPNLLELRLLIPSDSLRAASLTDRFLSSTLETLVFSGAGSDRTLASLSQRRLPRLKHLTLSPGSSDEIRPGTSADFCYMVETYPDLVSLTFSIPFGCNISILRSCAHHVHLRKLKLDWLGLSKRELETFRGFPSLEECTLVGANESIAHFLGCISSPKLRCLTIETFYGNTRSILLQHVGRFADLTYLHVTCHGIRCPWDQLVPMFSCSKIQTLRISGLSTTIPIDNCSMEELAMSLTNLKELDVRLFKQSSQVSLRGLEVFARYCPSLHSLTIPVGTQYEEDIFPMPFQYSSTTLTKLNLERSTIGDDITSIAKAIVNMFPNLREGRSSLYRMEEWREVWEAVRAAQFPEGKLDSEMHFKLDHDQYQYQVFQWGPAH